MSSGQNEHHPGQQAGAAEGMPEDVIEPGIQESFLPLISDQEDRRHGQDFPEDKERKKSPAKTTPRELSM